MPSPEIRIALKRLPHGEGLPLPAYATAHAAGMDVVAAEDVTLAPGLRHAVATGFAIAIPEGYEVQVRPRSGLALKHGIPAQHSGHDRCRLSRRGEGHPRQSRQRRRRSRARRADRAACPGARPARGLRRSPEA